MHGGQSCVSFDSKERTPKHNSFPFSKTGRKREREWGGVFFFDESLTAHFSYLSPMERALRRPVGVCGDGGEGAGSLADECHVYGEF